MPPITPGFRRGTLLDKFSLTVDNSTILHKGDISAVTPAFWGFPFIEISTAKTSFLNLMLLSDMTDKFAKVTFTMAIYNPSQGPGTAGNIQLKYIPQPNKPAFTVKQKVSANLSQVQYTFDTDTMKGSNINIQLSCADFNLLVTQVDVEIYNSFTMIK
jgi:hypothetical protein